MKMNVEETSSLLKRGEVVAFPTETVYGLGVSIAFPQAAEKIYTIKFRSKQKPLTLHLASICDVPTYAETCELFWALSLRFLPGPLTIVLPKRPGVEIGGSFPTIGVRIPDHAICQDLIRSSGPILGTSANISGKAALLSADAVFETFNGAISGILIDDAKGSLGKASTVIELRKNKPLLIREGAISFQSIISFFSQDLQISV